MMRGSRAVVGAGVVVAVGLALARLEGSSMCTMGRALASCIDGATCHSTLAACNCPL